MQLRKSTPNLRQLGIRVGAVLLALDEALAEADRLAGAVEIHARTRPLSAQARADLRTLLDALEADLRQVAAEHAAEDGSARDWAQRARLAAEAERFDLAALAERRHLQHSQAAVALAAEVARTQELMRHAEAVLSEAEGAAS